MQSHWPIRNKLFAGLALLVLIVGTLSASGLYTTYLYRSLVKSLALRAGELPLTTDLSQRVSDLRTTVADARMLSGAYPAEAETVAVPQYPYMTSLLATEFRTNVAGVKRALDRYQEQLRLNAERGGQIGDNSMERRTAEDMRLLIDRIEQSYSDEEWLLDVVRIGHLKADVEELKEKSAALPGYMQQNIENFSAESRGRYHTLLSLTWSATVAALALAGLFVRLFYVWVFRPLAELVKGSRRVAQGQFQHRIQLDTRDEMAELAQAMNEMTARFESIRDDLDRQVQERTKQVVRSEQLASVGFLAAGVAHEINNPLAAIALSAESMEGRLGGILRQDHPDHAVIRQYLAMIQNEAFRCKEITEKLLDFARMGDRTRQRTELADLIQGMIDMVRHLGRYHDKPIEFDPRWPVWADVNPQEMKQVVLNLLTNALDSIEPGGSVAVELGQEAGQAVITVSDNGCGMSEEVLEHLFEPFFTRRKNGQGTGLGLSISFRIVSDHQGVMEAHSAGPGTGARFRVRIPLSETVKETDHQYQAA